MASSEAVEAELDSIRQSNQAGAAEGGGAASSSMSSSGAVSHLVELEQEMKLLQWHKLANEASLKAALLRTKKLKREQQGSHASTREALEEKAAWMQQIVEEEHSKPLEVDAAFTADYERRERQEEERLEEEVGRHVQSLRRLREKLRDREEVRQRNMRYKREKRALAAGQRAAYEQQMRDGGAPDDEDREEDGGAEESQVTGTLSKVLHSLDKLVDLEKRIAFLETDAADSLEQSRGGSLTFTKRKAAPGNNAPGRTYFTVQNRGRARGGAGGKGARGRGAARRRGQAGQGQRGFVSSVPGMQRSAGGVGGGGRGGAGAASGLARPGQPLQRRGG
eukprot:g1655.t1